MNYLAKEDNNTLTGTAYGRLRQDSQGDPIIVPLSGYQQDLGCIPFHCTWFSNLCLLAHRRMPGENVFKLLSGTSTSTDGSLLPSGWFVTDIIDTTRQRVTYGLQHCSSMACNTSKPLIPLPNVPKQNYFLSLNSFTKSSILQVPYIYQVAEPCLGMVGAVYSPNPGRIDGAQFLLVAPAGNATTKPPAW